MVDYDYRKKINTGDTFQTLCSVLGIV